ncbi:enoyl-CoA hydratase [Kyrpidia spormannii]|uniref:Enoyl-CoA hydratase n=3 Tax=Kyrpidia TaxID=1129704 RepID=A0A2K8N3E0_9BACL|nr:MULTISPECIES: enoyl-CoA hydratase-related protein [Kyrpidia]ADG06811.1 Enoyl-CoA hydratase/isomerase [Kyrpidia tusciae DSM 2912]ATY83994.1 enoyl-CoA hydratase [Kyrpidia spormannii]CAB3389952.1 Enoyl-CoA hydratase [Kyrpidia spormannii]CAB3390850.1 Enoyl-CoA hydratase [Kyrpidia spormannii]
MTDKVTYEHRGSVAVITINRPEKLNCIDGETAEGLYAAWTRFRDDPAALVAILTGAGTAFSTGADLAAVDTLGPEDQYDPDFVYSGRGYLGFTRLTDVFKPTIAAINGYCFAGGMEMAAWCDIRIASSNAEFGLLERRWNVPLVDGGTQRLPRILGWGRAMDLMLTGRRIDARTAYDWGFVTEITEPDQLQDRAIALAEQIAAYPQGSLRTDKQAALRGWGLSLEESLRIETQLGMPHVRSEETREGLDRFRQRKRKDSRRT